MNERQGNVSAGRLVASTIGAGALCFAGYAVLEWVILFMKLPTAWSGSLVVMVLWNVLLYAGIGAVVGAVVAVVARVLKAITRDRWKGVATPAGARALLLGTAVLLYMLLSVNRLSPGGARAPVSLALDVVALIVAVVVTTLLLRSAGRAPRGGVARCVVLGILLVAPLYWFAAGGRVEHLEGVADLGPVDIEPGRAEPVGPNVVLIMLDTTRNDCLGCYGSEYGLTPAIDALAERSVLFESCVTPEPLTRPATATLFTGLYPMTHGVDTNTKALPRDITTLAEVLRDEGYTTGGFAAATVLSSFYGTSQGFDTYVEPTESIRALHRALALRQLLSAAGRWKPGAIELPADVMTDRAATWIAANRERPFFAYVHYFDPHWPYAPPEGFDLAADAGLADVPMPYSDPRDRFREGFRMPADYLRKEWLRYQGEIAFMDREVGRLLEELDRLGLEDDTIVVLVADHGEGFEHQFYFAHGNRLYDQLVAVAMMIRDPSAEPRRIPTQVRLLEVCPTIMGLVGVRSLPEMQGIDLTDVVRSGTMPAGDIPAFCQTDFEYSKPLSSRVSVGLRLPPWKYIDSPEIGLEELYNLESDPAETVNLATVESEVRRDLAHRVAEWLASTESRDVAPAELSPERLEALRALGYLQ